jgi:hypothetical protein
MTAQPTGHVMWTPDPIKQRAATDTLEKPFRIRLPIADLTP